MHSEKQNSEDMTMINQDALTGLKELESESVNCVVTSPPYWSLRDYGIESQLGLEPTFQEYITRLCDIFDEVKRVLRKDGTCFVNIGDTYYRDSSSKNYQPKCLVGIPFRFAIEMINRGWILRNTIIWHKPNAMPSGAKDRFTVDFEYVFFFVKNKKYWFETQYEPFVEGTDVWYRKKLRQGKKYNLKKPYEGNIPYTSTKLESMENSKGRIKRTVWKIPTKPFKGAHFATYPEALIEPMIQAGCPEGGVVLDPFMGAGTTALVARKQNKKFIGFEINKEYINLAMNRLKLKIEQTK